MNRIPLSPLPLATVFAGFFLSAACGGTGSDRPAHVESPAPLVIAHRGASGQRPEHTLDGYELALVQGADFIELDLVASRDGVLVARHENVLAVVALDDGVIRRDDAGRPQVLEATTDVATREAFADRLTVKRVDGRLIGGWFTEDFTYAELSTLRARERMPRIRPTNQLYDDEEGIPSLAQVLELIRRWEDAGRGSAGLYIELKHPTYFAVEGRHKDGTPIGMNLSVLLMDSLRAARFTDPERLFIQCFEVAPLIELKDRMTAAGLAIPLIQLYGDVHNRRYRAAPWDMVSRAGRGDTAIYGALVDLLPGGITTQVSFADLASAEVLGYIRQRYAAGIGPPLDNVLNIVPSADGGNDTLADGIAPLLGHARAAGLVVHPYTLRAEAPFLVWRDGRLMTVAEEAEALLQAGVDGFFIDEPDEGVLAVTRHRAALERAGSL